MTPLEFESSICWSIERKGLFIASPYEKSGYTMAAAFRSRFRRMSTRRIIANNPNIAQTSVKRNIKTQQHALCPILSHGHFVEFCLDVFCLKAHVTLIFHQPLCACYRRSQNVLWTLHRLLCQPCNGFWFFQEPLTGLNLHEECLRGIMYSPSYWVCGSCSLSVLADVRELFIA